MLLTFSRMYEKLLSQDKLQTIRFGWKRWIEWWDRRDRAMEPKRLQIYWKNPRNGGKKMGEGFAHSIALKTVGELTQEDAVLDGFLTLNELLFALEDINGHLDKDEYVAIIQWEWTDGPYDVREDKGC